MATLEERVTQLENDLKQFKAETVKAYQDLTVPFAIVRGLVESNVGQLALVRATQDEHTTMLREHTKRLDSIDARLNTFEQSVNGRFDALEQSMNSRFDQIMGVLVTLTNKPE